MPRPALCWNFTGQHPLCPCDGKDDGFKVIVVLPRGTNTDLEKTEAVTAEDRLLFARNKWLIAHPESGLDADGAFVGLKGENLTV